MWKYTRSGLSSNPEQGYDICFDMDAFPTPEQGEVMACALTVHEATGLTPAQLQARVAELEGALAAMVEFFPPYACGSADNRADALREAHKALGT